MPDLNQNAGLPPRKMHGPYKTDPFGAKIYGTSDKGGDCTVLDIRGWGYLTGRGQGALGMDDHPAMIEQQRFAGQANSAHKL